MNWWYINTAGLAITLIESQKGSASPFIPPQWILYYCHWFNMINAECLYECNSTRHESWKSSMVFANHLDLDLIVIIHFWKLGRLQRKPGIERRHNIKYVRYSRCKIVCRKYACTTFPVCMILKPHKKRLWVQEKYL